MKLWHECFITNHFNVKRSRSRKTLPLSEANIKICFLEKAMNEMKCFHGTYGGFAMFYIIFPASLE